MSLTIDELLINALNSFSQSKVEENASETLADVVRSLIEASDLEVKKISSHFLINDKLAIAMANYFQTEFSGTVNHNFFDLCTFFKKLKQTNFRVRILFVFGCSSGGKKVCKSQNFLCCNNFRCFCTAT